MKRLFKEFIMTRTFPHVMFESEVKVLFDDIHRWYKEKSYRTLKGLSMKMLSGFLKQEGIIITPARRKPLIFHRPKGIRTSIKKLNKIGEDVNLKKTKRVGYSHL